MKFSFVPICCLLVCCCASVKVNCNKIGVYEEDLMIIGYELNKINRSLEDNKKCMQLYLQNPKKNDSKCWRQLATTSGTQSVGGIFGEHFDTIDESFISTLRTLATTYNTVIDEIETYYTSIIEKSNYEHFQMADPNRVSDLISQLNEIDEETEGLRTSLQRMTGVEPSGEWGYCNHGDKGRAEVYVLKSTRSVYYAWEPLKGE